ncbi:MAG: hypothetical protein NTV06_01630 [candidate division Zixibacteria bacterium]|nr:hypothetical protein [candidate division Zixibacteria bacterium]
MHDLSFDASVVYPIEFRVVSPYLGGGVGSHRLGFTHLEPAAFSLTDNKIKVPESTTRIGYHLVGGINITSPLLPFEIVVEFRYNWINTPGKMTTYNCLTAGINYNLP